MIAIGETAVAKRIKNSSIVGRAVSNFAWSIASEAIGKSIFFFTNIYLARVLGVADFGLFTLSQTITYYFWLAADLGTNMYGIREIAKNKQEADKIVNLLLTLRMVAGLIIFVLYSSSLFLISMPTQSRFTFLSCGFYILTYSFYTDWVFKGLEKFKFIAFGSIVSSVVFLAGVLLFVKSSENIIATSLIWSFSYLFGSIALLYFLSKSDIRLRLSFDLKNWLSHVKESIYFTVSGGLMMLYQYIPVLLLSVFFTNREVGLFSAPYRAVITICAAGFLLPMALYPIFSELYKQDRAKFRRTHRAFQALMLALGLIIAIPSAKFSNEITQLLFGGQYLESSTVFTLLIWLVPLYFIRYTYGSILMATGFQRHHNIATMTGVVSVIIFGLILIPKSNTIGSAWALLYSEAIMVIAMLLISQRTFKRA